MIEIIKEQYKLRIYEEGIFRIAKVLDLLTEEQVWYSPNEQMNSIGNLILHLNGNVTQWVGTGIAKDPDIRQRDEEFTAYKTHSKKELKEKLERLKNYTFPIIDNLTEEQLSDQRTIQGFNETVLSIIIHVIEHFSYHVGQIAYLAKLIIKGDLGFYEGMDLNVIS